MVTSKQVDVFRCCCCLEEPVMLLNNVFERFASKSPATVMLRGALEYAFPPECVDRLFRELSVNQYEDDLLFSTVVDVLSLAVTRNRKSVHSAYLASKEQVQVSVA